MASSSVSKPATRGSTPSRRKSSSGASARGRFSMYRSRSVIPSRREESRRGLGRDKTLIFVELVVLLTFLLAACSQKMRDMPKLNPDEPTILFPNGTSSQLPVQDTVAQGYLRDDVELFT